MVRSAWRAEDLSIRELRRRTKRLTIVLCGENRHGPCMKGLLTAFIVHSAILGIMSVLCEV